MLQSTTEISAQQSFAVAIDKKICFIGEPGTCQMKDEPYLQPHFPKKGGTFPYALKFFKV